MIELKRLAREARVRRVFDSGILDNIDRALPPSECRHCEGGERSNPPAESSFMLHHKGGFDENGYPINVLCKKELNTITSESESMEQLVAKKPFRFLDLPPELRIRVYEFAFTTDEPVVCVSDAFFAHAGTITSADEFHRSCTHESTCLPCLMHESMGTMGASGLAHVNKQLHTETFPIPYTVTTFSVHNIYDLQNFLTMIGSIGRKALKSLRFDFKIPEQEAYALEFRADILATMQLLWECTNLTSLDVDMHVWSLLSRDDSGMVRPYSLFDHESVPHLGWLGMPRGLRRASFAWMEEAGVCRVKMEEYARWVLGVWCLEREADMANVMWADSEIEMGRGSERRISWSIE